MVCRQICRADRCGAESTFDAAASAFDNTANHVEFSKDHTLHGSCGCIVKSWEVLRDAIDRVGVKAVAARLNLSTAMIYKWCQEAAQDDADSSGALNPLDRLKSILELTQDPRLANWLCNVVDGFYVANPHVEPEQQDELLLAATQRVVQDFGELLREVSRSAENDGTISQDEAVRIRQSWERLKGQAESFVVACERGRYRQRT